MILGTIRVSKWIRNTPRMFPSTYPTIKSHYFVFKTKLYLFLKSLPSSLKPTVAPPIVLDDTCFDFKLHVEYKIVSCRALKPYLTSIILEKHHKFWVRMSDLYILMYSYPLERRQFSPLHRGHKGSVSSSPKA